jgi:prepilin-type N-terminal cleavage/methylation domain-containing protein
MSQQPKLRILNQKKSGFTMIEVVVTLTIIVIISTSAYLAFTRYQQDQFLNLSAEEIRISLEEARSKAIQGVNLSEHGVYFDATAGIFVLFQGSSFAVRNATYDINHTLTVKMAGPSEIVFAKLKGTTAATSITLTNEHDKQQIININAAGTIE